MSDDVDFTPPECNRCGETENVVQFRYLDREDKSGTEYLCWPHRESYIRERIHPDVDDTAASSVSAPEGQATFGDFA